jgi:hypothetical protein
MGWWSEASRGAAREFGRRHTGLFATIAFLRWALPALLVLAVVGLVGGTVWAVAAGAATLATTWVKPAVAAGAIVGVLAVLVLAWRRWGLIWRLYGAAPVAGTLVVLAVLGAGTWLWLST